jgi:hypothetical protein
MKKFLLITTMALVSVFARAQTTYNLPSTPSDYITYTYPHPYANLFSSDIPVTINAVPYALNIAAHTDSTGTCITTCYITFQNLNTGEQTPVPYTGGFTTITYDTPTTINGKFSGAFNGSFVLNLVPVNGRRGPVYHTNNSTLTIN